MSPYRLSVLSAVCLVLLLVVVVTALYVGAFSQPMDSAVESAVDTAVECPPGSGCAVAEESFANLNEWHLTPMTQINQALRFRVEPAEFPDFIALLSTHLRVPSETTLVPPDDPNTWVPLTASNPCYSDYKGRVVKYNGAEKKFMLPNLKTQREKFQKCMEIAKSVPGATYFSLEYGNECFVGNQLNTSRMESKALHNCNRAGYPNGTGGGWAQMIYRKPMPVAKKEFRPAEYRSFVQNLVDSGIRSYMDLKNSIRVNEHFTPLLREGATGFAGNGGHPLLRGAVPPPPPSSSAKPADPAATTPPPGAAPATYPKTDAPSQYLDNTDVVVLPPGAQLGINNNVLKTLDAQFQVERQNYGSLVANTRDQQELQKFLNEMKELGFKSEGQIDIFLGGINNLQFRGYVHKRNLSMVVNMLRSFHLSVADIVDLSSQKPGPFTVTCRLLGVANNRAGIPLFPSLYPGASAAASSPTWSATNQGATAGRSVLQDLADIHVDPRDMSAYLQEFKYKDASVTPAVYFRVIHPILKSPTFQFIFLDIPQLQRLLQDVGVSGNLVDDFQRFASILQSLGINNHAEYTSFIGELKTAVGVPLRITELMPKFRAYMNGPAYAAGGAGDGGSPPVPMDPSMIAMLPPIPEIIMQKPAEINRRTLLQVIDALNQTGYQFNDRSDFVMFWEKLTTNRYSLERIYNDTLQGETYASFMGQRESFLGSIWRAAESFVGTTHESFSQLFRFVPPTATPPSRQLPAFDVGNGRPMGSPVSSVTNNADAPSPADYAILNAFGIVDFGDPLQQWKEVLRQRGVQPWKEVMDVTRSLVILKMSAQDMERFAQLMDRFGANEVTYWMGFLRVSGELGLQGYTQVSGFVESLVNFGVSYRRNYQRFLGQLSMFIGGPLKTMKVANFYTFVNDMKQIGLDYGTSPSEVDDLMNYFAKQQISLNTYAEGPLHNAVLFMYQYSQNAGSLCPNRLADLRWSRVNGAETYGGKDRRTVVLETLSTLGNGSANVEKRHRQYVLTLSSYLFREEYLEWQQATSGDRYTDNAKTQMFRDIAATMAADNVNQGQIDPQTRTQLANMCALFPAFMFEMCMNQVRKCAPGDQCDLYCDPEHERCRVATSRPDKQIRKVLLAEGQLISVARLQPNRTSNR